MSLADLKISGDTGWRAEPRYAPQDVLDSGGTVMHGLSTPSCKRTITGYYEGDASEEGAGISVGDVVTVGGVTGILLSLSGQRLQNIGATQWWVITAELQKEYT